MDKLENLQEKKNQLAREITALRDMRQGSIVEQYFETKKKDGSVVKHGPYLLYSYKANGKTISRRLTGALIAKRYREEINEYRRFEKLCAELVETSHKICDLKEEENEDTREKKRLKRSRKRSKKNSKA